MTDVERIIAVVTRKKSKRIIEVADCLIEKLNRKGFKVFSFTSQEKRPSEKMFTVKGLKAIKPEIVVTVGGDGLLLWVLREMDDNTPVLSVNVGGRGILSEVIPENLENSVERIYDRKYFIKNRMRISASIGSIALPPALNEIYLSRISETKTSTYNIFINGYSLKQRMDGLMITTPTGSTGHSLSFGGPFIHSETSALLMMPVGSISRLPPIIFPNDTIEVNSDHDSVLVIDGQKEVMMEASEKVLIKKHKRDARFIRFEENGMRQLQNLGF